MLLEQLSINHCRIIEHAELDLSPSVNLICGDNGSGKSSILEAVSILSSGRSFRTSRIADVIRNTEDALLIRARSIEDDNSFVIGIERSKNSTRIRVNQQNINTQAALSRYLPVTIIDPNSVELITGSALRRRAYLDWIAFYSFPGFYRVWQNYQRILKQRNLCLRIPSYLSALPQWTDELIRAQTLVQGYRERSINALMPRLADLGTALLDSKQLTIKLTSGFAQTMEDLSFAAQREFYLNRRDSDIKSGRTLSGVHRSDLQIYFSGQLAQHSASRGQLLMIWLQS